MAERKFLFQAADGWGEEAAATDHLVMSGLVIGAGSYSAGKITGLTGGSADGDALAYGQSSANLAGLTIDTANLVMSGVTITGLPTTPTGSTEATSKAYVDSLVSGLKWRDPASVLRIKSDADQSGADPVAGSTGEAWLVNNWLNETDGDIVEWDGAAWQVIVANSGGEPPDGTRVVVIESGAAGSFAGEEDNIGTYDATGDSWSFEATTEGWALIITGEGSYYENTGWTYDNGSWIQFTGAGQINAGDGLSKDGNTLDVNAGDGITFVTDRVTVDLDASNSGLEFTGTTPDKTLGVLANTAAGLDIDASGVKVVLESDAGIVFDAGNGGLEINLEATNPTLDIVTNELGVKYSTTASGLDQDANGLKVKVDTTTIAINGSGQLYALGGAEAQRIENDLTVGENVTAGDPVYFDATDDQVAKGDAGTDSKKDIIGVARSTIGSGNPCPIVSHGPCAGVLTTATAGTPYYLADGGGLTTTVPGSGKNVVLVGYALNEDDLWVHIQYFAKKAA
jgi:hypothetical protein